MAKSAHAKRSSSPSFEKEAERAAKDERAIQRKVDRSDQKKGTEESGGGAMQAGARVYPVPPLPEQHLTQAGLGGRARAQADVRRPALQGLGEAARQGRADHRRRFRHRPRGRGAVRARGRRRRGRLSRRARGRRGDQAARSRRKAAAAFSSPATSPIPNSARTRSRRPSTSSAGSTSSSTTPPSRSTSTASRT